MNQDFYEEFREIRIGRESFAMAVEREILRRLRNPVVLKCELELLKDLIRLRRSIDKIPGIYVRLTE